jgi:hypothetical protein
MSRYRWVLLPSLCRQRKNRWSPGSTTFFLVSDQAQSLFTYFKDTFQLPQVWPFRQSSTFASGGLWVGNAVLEFASFPKEGGQPRKTGGIAFEPTADADATAAELTKRSIPHHTEVRSSKSQIAGKQIAREWSLIWLTDLPPTAADVFFVDYKDRQAAAQRPRAASAELARRWNCSKNRNEQKSGFRDRNRSRYRSCWSPKADCDHR